MFYNGQVEMNSNKKQEFRIVAEHIEQILIQNTSTLPEKGTFRNERPKTADNETVESQTTGPRGEIYKSRRAQQATRVTLAQTTNTKVRGDAKGGSTISGPGAVTV